jgi:SAM-dependent methyltransferase
LEPSRSVCQIEITVPFVPNRRVQPEILDTLPDHLASENLADLRRINRWFGGRQVLNQVFSSVARRQDSFNVLDVGAASGDLGRYLTARFPRARVVSLDLRKRNLQAAPPPKLVADAFRLPFRPRSFDYVLASHFLHHFEDNLAAELLSRLYSLARRALVIVDLERCRWSYYFLPTTRFLFRWSPLTVHDGKISVQAAFQPRELVELAALAGLPAPVVRRHFPWFRVSLVAPVDRGALLSSA